MRFSSVRAVGVVVGVGLLATTLAGCGRRGQLEPPPDPTVQAPAADSTAPIARRPKRVPIQVPHEPFVLDPLL